MRIISFLNRSFNYYRLYSTNDESLMQIYQKTLDLLSQIKDDSFYKQSIYSLTQSRIKQLEESSQSKVQCIESLALAKRELSLTEKMVNDWQPWNKHLEDSIPEDIWK